MNEAASRYGLALYSLAIDNNKVDQWQMEVKEIMRAFKENADFIMVLGSTFLPLEERKAMLEKTLVGVSKEIIALLEIIMENHRTNSLLDILEGFNSYCNEYKGVEEGYVYSSLRLDESSIRKIEEKISLIEHHKVELKNVIDPNLIGGVKIVIHDKIYDGSVKARLEKMSKDLLKKEGK